MISILILSFRMLQQNGTLLVEGEQILHLLEILSIFSIFLCLFSSVSRKVLCRKVPLFEVSHHIIGLQKVYCSRDPTYGTCLSFGNHSYNHDNHLHIGNYKL